MELTSLGRSRSDRAFLGAAGDRGNPPGVHAIEKTRETQKQDGSTPAITAQSRGPTGGGCAGQKRSGPSGLSDKYQSPRCAAVQMTM